MNHKKQLSLCVVTAVSFHHLKWLFQCAAVVEYQRAVQKQDILSVKIQKFREIRTGDITDIHQRDTAVILQQQGDDATAK